MRQRTQTQISDLEARSNRGLWSLALFVAISIGGASGFAFLPDLPPQWRQALGPPPPVHLLNLGLFIYSFSAALLTLAKMMEGSAPRNSLISVAALVIFYIFYTLAGALADHFWAIFAAGMTTIGLESYHIWVHHADDLREARERLAAIPPAADER